MVCKVFYEMVDQIQWRGENSFLLGSIETRR